MTCKNIQCTQKFSSTHTGEKFIIYCNANCKTENIIYLLECAICGLQYIGETKQQLSKRSFIIPLGVMVNYGDLQFAERVMVARRSEMSAEWKVMFAIYIASVAIQAFTKLLLP
jgi:uncharacterized ferredoxin-like protein